MTWDEFKGKVEPLQVVIAIPALLVLTIIQFFIFLFVCIRNKK